MTQSENQLLSSPTVDKLATLIEEATRATKDSPRRFIEPARGTLDRAKSRRHHIVFGRRGSGKTSLLRKASADLTLHRVPIAFIDLEAFKGHTYPDVLLSVLIETMEAFDKWLASAGVNPASKKSFWHLVWGGKPDRPPLDKNKVEVVRRLVQQQIKELQNLLHSEDDAQLTARSAISGKATVTEKNSIAAALPTGAIAAGNSY